MTRTAATKKRRAARPRKSPEQIQEEAEQLHDALVNEIQQLTESDGWMRFLRFAQSFHSYSVSNLLLIHAQMPTATAVAGFRAWQAKGRQVRKGERALKIRGFSTSTRREEDPETGEEVETRTARYPLVSVFDISQTDPIEGTEPYQSVTHITGTDPSGIYAAIACHLRGQGWSVTREPIQGETNGYTTVDGTRRVVVDDELAPAMAAKTILHEAAHAHMHAHLEDAAAQYVAHRGRCECEAESVAYVLAGLAGLDTAPYSVGYIAEWTRGDLDTVRNAAAAVLQTVRALAPVLLPTEPDVP